MHVDAREMPVDAYTVRSTESITERKHGVDATLYEPMRRDSATNLIIGASLEKNKWRLSVISSNNRIRLENATPSANRVELEKHVESIIGHPGSVIPTKKEESTA
ncbi:hypothetical protein MMC06_001810 [Schaereria dolodes]|nr:hypothetical protein [Schaereria dolodes]